MNVCDNLFVSEILNIVGKDRVRNNKRECRLYSYDIGVMPPLVTPLVNAGTAGAVVRPENEEQLAKIVALAKSRQVPLVARGGATSGYGGVLPHEGGLVIDLSGWQEILSIDKENMQVTTQPGAIWKYLDKKLAREGLQSRLHPSSYPSSTVGGWLAQDGSGFGSYEYGPIRDNVVSARVLAADGTFKTYSGDALTSYVAGAEGITGIITEVTIGVRELEPNKVKLISFPKVEDLTAALQEISAAKLPIWSITFFNPTAIDLKHKLPGKDHHHYEKAHVSREVEMNLSIPVSYVGVIAYPESRAEAIEDSLQSIAQAHEGTFLSQEAADFEWEERSGAMKLKRMGPSIIATEAIVPLENLAQALNKIDDKLDQPFVLEGMVGRGDYVVLLGYIPHDEGKVAFNVAYALSLVVMDIAREFGGSVYASGIYFRNRIEEIRGKEEAAKLKKYKLEVDPDMIMNPGKVIAFPHDGGGALDKLMSSANAMLSLALPIANASKSGSARDENCTKAKNGVPGNTRYMATACARCGYCVQPCEQFSVRGWESQSPRGKYGYIRDVVDGKDEWDQSATNTFLSCTTCEACNYNCQLSLPIAHDGMALRGELVNTNKFGTFPPFEMMAASLQAEGNIWAGQANHRADWVPEDVAEKIPEKSDVLYFAGCTASFVENDIAEATMRLLQDAGYRPTYMGEEENCCGIPMKMAGKWDLFEEIYERNVAAARSRGVKTIVTSCPACALVWKEMYPKIAEKKGEAFDFDVKHYSELVAPALADGRLSIKKNPYEGKRVTFHDSCHAGRGQGIYEPPRDMLKAIPNLDYVEMEHNRQDGICCGSVVTLVGEIETAPKLGKMRLQEAVDVQADAVVALCPCCQVQLRDSADKAGMDIEIDDLAHILAEATGHDIPNSKPYTLKAWGIFDKFIWLMKPAKMAAFMGPLIPEMVDAMPSSMATMMRGMAKTSAGRKAMASMMPSLFPKMAPDIMEKIMPSIVAEALDYMGEMTPDMEVLMPELLPKTMESLMPKYIPELIPYLTPRFINYLAEGNHMKVPADPNNEESVSNCSGCSSCTAS